MSKNWAHLICKSSESVPYKITIQSVWKSMTWTPPPFQYQKLAREREREEKERKKESDWIQEWFLLASNENIIYLLQFHCSIVQREINFEIIFVVILCWNFKKYVFTPFRGSWNSSTAASWWSQWHQGIYYSKIMKSGWRLQVTWLVFANWSAQLGMLLTNLLMTPVTRIYSINT